MAAGGRNGSDLDVGEVTARPGRKEKRAGWGRLLLLAAGVLALAVLIYSGIHSRVSADAVLRSETEQATVRDVIVVTRRQARPPMKWFYPEAHSLLFTRLYMREPAAIS
jgi:hypothetical protein